MMKINKNKPLFIGALSALLCVGLLLGCSDKDVKNLGGITDSSSVVSSDSTVENSSPVESSAENEDSSAEKRGIDYIPEKFKAGPYSENLSDKRKNIDQVKADYDEQSAELKKNGINNMNFEKCVFKPLPDFDNISTYFVLQPKATPENSWSMIEYWLKKMGIYEKVDMDKEVVDNSRAAEEGEEKGYGIWPLAKNFYDEATGKWNGTDGRAFSFLNDNYGYIQMGGSNVMVISYGKVAAYYSEKTGDELDRSIDPYRLLGAQVVEEGSYEELKNHKYELFDGEMTVEEATRAIKDYFDFDDKKTGYDIYHVEVHKEFDKYVYRFLLRRTYCGIPLTWDLFGQISNYGDISLYSPAGDYILVVVCDSEGLDAKYGGVENDTFEKIIADQTQIIDIQEAAEKIKEAVSKEYKCDMLQAEFTFLKYELVAEKSTEGYILVPAWEFIGKNQVDDQRIKIYVDALTGDVCFYEFMNSII